MVDEPRDQRPRIRLVVDDKNPDAAQCQRVHRLRGLFPGRVQGGVAIERFGNFLSSYRQ